MFVYSLKDRSRTSSGNLCSTRSRRPRASMIYVRQIFVAYKSLYAAWERCFYATRRRLRVCDLSPVRGAEGGVKCGGDWKTERNSSRERNDCALEGAATCPWSGTSRRVGDGHGGWKWEGRGWQ